MRRAGQGFYFVKFPGNPGAIAFANVHDCVAEICAVENEDDVEVAKLPSGSHAGSFLVELQQSGPDNKGAMALRGAFTHTKLGGVAARRIGLRSRLDEAVVPRQVGFGNRELPERPRMRDVRDQLGKPDAHGRGQDACVVADTVCLWTGCCQRRRGEQRKSCSGRRCCRKVYETFHPVNLL